MTKPKNKRARVRILKDVTVWLPEGLAAHLVKWGHAEWDISLAQPGPPLNATPDENAGDDDDG